MQREIAHGWGGGYRAASVTQLLGGKYACPQVMLNLIPGPLILRLLLAPDNFFGLRVALELGCECLSRKGM